MARKKKLYLVWQSMGSFDTYYNRMCGVFDSEDRAFELKAKLDKNVVLEKQCWTIMPEEVFSEWPVIDEDDLNSFEYVSEYKGYTKEQRDEQESRWHLMLDDYSYATIQEVNMNEEIEEVIEL